MRRATRHRLRLLIVVSVLAALAAWQWRRQQQAHPRALLDLDPAAITDIEVRTPQGPLRRFKLGPHGCRMLAPQTAAADTEHCRRLASIAAARVLRWRAASDFNLARIGLIPARAVLRLNDRTLSFGALAALAPQRYVRVDDHVALIPARYARDLLATPDSELAHTGSSTR